MVKYGCSAVKIVGCGWGGLLIGLIPQAKADKAIEFI